MIYFGKKRFGDDVNYYDLLAIMPKLTIEEFTKAGGKNVQLQGQVQSGENNATSGDVGKSSKGAHGGSKKK